MIERRAIFASSPGYFILDGSVVVAPIEVLEVEGLCRLGAPQAQQRAGVDSLTENGSVIGNTDEPLPAPSTPCARWSLNCPI
jgi:hypothetical protein